MYIKWSSFTEQNLNEFESKEMDRKKSLIGWVPNARSVSSFLELMYTFV